MFAEDEEFIAIVVRILSRDDFLYDAAQRLLLCFVSTSRMSHFAYDFFLTAKGQEMTEADIQRLNTVRETVARISQHWLLSEIRETETSSHYIRNIEILRCLLQNGKTTVFPRSSFLRTCPT